MSNNKNLNLFDIQSQIDSLREEISIHNKNYYELDSPTIEDSEYDALFRQLKKLETEYPQFASKSSPTQKVGGKSSEKFKKHTHKYPLYSLDNSNNIQELEKWYERIKKNTTQNIELECELKERYKGKLGIVRSSATYLEITNPLASKGNALKKLMEMWKLSADEVLASGDQDNDIELLKVAGVRVAMKNASSGLKSVANYITQDVHQDGWADAIERLVLCE